jgi:hypothetical protein
MQGMQYGKLQEKKTQSSCPDNDNNDNDDNHDNDDDDDDSDGDNNDNNTSSGNVIISGSMV